MSGVRLGRGDRGVKLNVPANPPHLGSSSPASDPGQEWRTRFLPTVSLHPEW